MNCNGIINQARHHCIEQIKQYHKEYEATGNSGASFYRYIYLKRVLYWTEVFVDQSFSSADECKLFLETIAQEQLGKIEPELPNLLTKKMVDTVAFNYTALLKSVDNDKNIDMPYSRTIIGAERNKIEQQLMTKWNYTGTCWNPLTKATQEETLFLMSQHLEPYYEKICAIPMISSGHIFISGEGLIESDHCIETDSIDLYHRLPENVYFDQEANWIIYSSHESTITFAGTILPEVKVLLADIRDKWNKFEWA